jgi:hypothetical protein
VRLRIPGWGWVLGFGFGPQPKPKPRTNRSPESPTPNALPVPTPVFQLPFFGSSRPADLASPRTPSTAAATYPNGFAPSTAVTCTSPIFC